MAYKEIKCRNFAFFHVEDAISPFNVLRSPWSQKYPNFFNFWLRNGLDPDAVLHLHARPDHRQRNV
jgi:hypothetical protein